MTPHIFTPSRHRVCEIATLFFFFFVGTCTMPEGKPIEVFGGGKKCSGEKKLQRVFENGKVFFGTDSKKKVFGRETTNSCSKRKKNPQKRSCSEPD